MNGGPPADNGRSLRAERPTLQEGVPRHFVQSWYGFCGGDGGLPWYPTYSEVAGGFFGHWGRRGRLPPTTSAAEVGRQTVHDFDSVQTHLNDLPDQKHDVLRVVLAVGVGADARARVDLDTILINHPIQRAAVAKPILECFVRDTGEGQGVIDHERLLVFGKTHLFDDIGRGFVVVENFLEVVRFDIFVLKVQGGQFFASIGERFEVGRVGDAWEFTFETVAVLFAIAWVVEDAWTISPKFVIDSRGGFLISLGNVIYGGHYR